MHAPILAPSLLAGDHAHLAATAQLVEQTGLNWLHIDIMDGHFVPNLTFGPQTVAALRPHSKLFFDVHLMLDQPQKYIEAFIHAGANSVSIHIEPDYDHKGTLARIRELGACSSVVLNPGTPVEAVRNLLNDVDMILVMTVQPGFGGQSFRADMMTKLETLSQWRREQKLSFRLEVDGGVDLETAPLCRRAGADTFVAGTAFMKAEDKRAFADEFARMG